jgi:hypothetical protein
VGAAGEEGGCAVGAAQAARSNKTNQANFGIFMRRIALLVPLTGIFTT